MAVSVMVKWSDVQTSIELLFSMMMYLNSDWGAQEHNSSPRISASSFIKRKIKLVIPPKPDQVSKVRRGAVANS